MKYASNDWVGLVFVIGLILFRMLPQILRALGNVKPDEPEAPRKARPQTPRREGPTDPFEDLMEALGNKPKRSAQSSPQSTSPPPLVKPAVRKPIPPYVPPVLQAPAKPRTFQLPPQQPVRQPAEQPAMGSGTQRGETARVEAELAQKEHNPYFIPAIGSQPAASVKAVEQMAPPTVASQTLLVAQKDARSAGIALLLKDPVTLRRAILANEILGKPVALRGW